MALMTWKADYSVNIKQIDDQHKKLIELINTLHDAMAKGHAKEALHVHKVGYAAKSVCKAAQGSAKPALQIGIIILQKICNFRV